jgi:hypothetical protein
MTLPGLKRRQPAHRLGETPDGVPVATLLQRNAAPANDIDDNRTLFGAQLYSPSTSYHVA